MNAFDELVTLCGVAKAIEGEAEDLRRQGLLSKAVGSAPTLAPEVRSALATVTELNRVVDQFADHVQGGHQSYVRPSRPTTAAPSCSPRFPDPPQPRPVLLVAQQPKPSSWVKEKGRLLKAMDDAIEADQLSVLQVCKLENLLNHVDAQRRVTR